MRTPHHSLLSEAEVKGHMSQEIFVLVSGNGCFHLQHNDQEMSFVLRGDGPGYSGARGSLGVLQGVESLLGQSLNTVSPQDQCIVSCKRELGVPGKEDHSRASVQIKCTLHLFKGILFICMLGHSLLGHTQQNSRATNSHLSAQELLLLVLGGLLCWG